MEADVVVVGSGQAGVPLASALAKAGKQVVVVERGELGGTCVNTGCTPTKTMIASARAAHVARNAERLGVQLGDDADVRVDFRAVVARKDAIVARWRAGVTKRLSQDGIRLVHGHARFVGPRTIEAAGERFTAETIVINTGARPVVPPIDGLDRVPFLDNASVMALDRLPKHLVVLGGGTIGCELGQMFRRFGSQVTILDSSTTLLSREDADVSSALAGAFQREGIGLALGVHAKAVREDLGDVVVTLEEGGEVRGSHLLVAVGRRPNTDDLGCDAAGIALGDGGWIVVDEGYSTSVPGVYAVGDVDGGPQFTHTSWDDHRVLLERLLGRPARKRTDRIVPSTVFTDPQVASVGLGERDAKRDGIDHEVATMPFGDVARAIEVDETAGLLKVLVDPKTERILGARIVGSEAGELIHVFLVLMQAKASARAIVDAEFVHPTYAEGVQSVVMRIPRFSR